jgi:hypothetical protein
MTADVYAGDDDLRGGARPTAATRFLFRIECDAEPDALGRICNQLNFANAAPWRLELVTTDGGQLVVDVELRGIADPLAELIRRKLLQQTCVTRVELYVPG